MKPERCCYRSTQAGKHAGACESFACSCGAPQSLVPVPRGSTGDTGGIHAGDAVRLRCHDVSSHSTISGQQGQFRRLWMPSAAFVSMSTLATAQGLSALLLLQAPMAVHTWFLLSPCLIASKCGWQPHPQQRGLDNLEMSSALRPRGRLWLSTSDGYPSGTIQMAADS